jgi:hypothetical protein
MERPAFRKPKLYFDTAEHPSHVTFDDGKAQRRNFPWSHYIETRWDYAEPDVLKVEIGDWQVVVRGHNLASLFQAIEEHTLARLRAHPELEQAREHEADTFAVEVRFVKPPPGAGADKRRGQIEIELGR